MAITKETIIDKIEVLEHGSIQIRRATYFVEDGVRVGNPTYHRHVKQPGEDVSGEDARVQAIANTDWTPTRIAAFQAFSSAPVSPNALPLGGLSMNRSASCSTNRATAVFIRSSR